MNASPIHIEVEQLKTEIRDRLSNRMLLDYTGEPGIGFPVLFSLILPELNGEDWQSSDRTAATAVGALHAAFHAHDSIEDRGAPSRRQQLTVLAGDYYSGIHYRILAGIRDTVLLRELAHSVIRMTECKASLYERQPGRSASDVTAALDVIEAAALTAFLRSRGLPGYAEAAAHALVAGRLGRERDDLLSGRSTPFCSAVLQSEDIGGDRRSAAEFLDAVRLETVSRGLASVREISRPGRLAPEEIAAHLGLFESAPTQSGKKV